MKKVFCEFRAPLKKGDDNGFGAAGSVDSQSSGNDEESKVMMISQLKDHPDSVETLCNSFLNDRNTHAVNEAAIYKLSEMVCSESFSALMTILEGENVSWRNATITALSQHPEHLERHLESVRSHPNSDVRIFVMNILALTVHDNTERWIVTFLESEDNVNVCAAGLEALEEVGTEYCLPILQKIREKFSDNPFILFVCDRVIKSAAGQ